MLCVLPKFLTFYNGESVHYENNSTYANYLNNKFLALWLILTSEFVEYASASARRLNICNYCKMRLFQSQADKKKIHSSKEGYKTTLTTCIESKD
jgi:hypothetical protein